MARREANVWRQSWNRESGFLAAWRVGFHSTPVASSSFREQQTSPRSPRSPRLHVALLATVLVATLIRRCSWLSTLPHGAMSSGVLPVTDGGGRVKVPVKVNGTGGGGACPCSQTKMPPPLLATLAVI